jgi:predicted RND superfamily exporter protein
VVVVVVMLVMYLSAKRALLAALPLTFGYLFLLAGVQVAQLAGWDFALNYVNLMVFPLLLGTGIDYGIYMVSDAYSERRPSLAQLISETGLSVFVACLTTLAGFGSMVFSNYTGLVSFGWAALLGYSGTLFGALVVLPALLGWLGVREGGAAPAAPEPH